MPLYFDPDQLRAIARGEDQPSRAVVDDIRAALNRVAGNAYGAGATSLSMGDAAEVIVALADALEANGRVRSADDAARFAQRVQS
ncbi:MAG: hypothetical protein ABSD03_17665 [Vulcanimicrobiaceae bacterium]|jgi:hypothetical protein